MKAYPVFFQVVTTLLYVSENIKMATAMATNTVNPANNVFWESFPQISNSALAYIFTSMVELGENNQLQLVVPEKFPINGEDLKKFTSKRMDLTKYDNDGNNNGVSFYQLNELVKANEDLLAQTLADGKFNALAGKIVKDIRNFIDLYDGKVTRGLFLSFHCSIQRSNSCVYSIFKDTINKQITVAFRGSVKPLALFTGTNKDWRRNFQPGLADLDTPKLIKHKMKGRLQERVKVRRGFYEYLFDNEVEIQRYEKIRRDIQTLIKDETDDYKICVTGHSLGGALASLCAFDLAGCDKDEETLQTGEVVPIPKPVTCITWAAPPVGTDGFRIAHEHLEKEGFLRCLRINNWDDIVPTLPPVSPTGVRRMTHAGINIRLTDSTANITDSTANITDSTANITDSTANIEHSSRAGFRTALKNSLIKPFWRNLRGKNGPHLLKLHRERFIRDQQKLEALTIDDLYKDDKVVSKDFIDDNF